MVLFLTGLVEGLGRTVISGIDNIDADYFLLSDSAEKLITVSDLSTEKYDELCSQTDAETAVLGIQRMYLSKKGSDEKLNITYFVIEPGSFLEPNLIDGTNLADSDMSIPLYLTKVFRMRVLRWEMWFSIRRRSFNLQSRDLRLTVCMGIPR